MGRGRPPFWSVAWLLVVLWWRKPQSHRCSFVCRIPYTQGKIRGLTWLSNYQKTGIEFLYRFFSLYLDFYWLYSYVVLIDKIEYVWKIKKRTLMKNRLKGGLIESFLIQKRLKNSLSIVKMSFSFLALKWWQSGVLWA